MPAVDEKVMKFVEDLLKKTPDIQNSELFDRAKKAHSSMRKLSPRQFNARYPLQVKRRRALAVRGAGGGRKKAPSPGRRRLTPLPPGDPRDVVRHVLLQFATDITAAEERKDLVKVLAGVDFYVDQVLKGLKKV